MPRVSDECTWIEGPLLADTCDGRMSFGAGVDEAEVITKTLASVTVAGACSDSEGTR